MTTKNRLTTKIGLALINSELTLNELDNDFKNKLTLRDLQAKVREKRLTSLGDGTNHKKGSTM